MKVAKLVKVENQYDSYYQWQIFIRPDTNYTMDQQKVVLLNQSLNRCFVSVSTNEFYDFLGKYELLVLHEEINENIYFVGFAFDWYNNDITSEEKPANYIKILKRWPKPENMDWDTYNNKRSVASIRLANYLKSFFNEFKVFLYPKSIVSFFPQSSLRSRFQPWDSVRDNFKKDGLVISIAERLLEKKANTKKQIECTNSQESIVNIRGNIELNKSLIDRVNGMQIIIIDDICGYGGTFIESLKAVQSISPRAFCLAMAKDKK